MIVFHTFPSNQMYQNQRENINHLSTEFFNFHLSFPFFFQSEWDKLEWRVVFFLSRPNWWKSRSIIIKNFHYQRCIFYQIGENWLKIIKFFLSDINSYPKKINEKEKKVIVRGSFQGFTDMITRVFLKILNNKFDPVKVDRCELLALGI